MLALDSTKPLIQPSTTRPSTTESCATVMSRSDIRTLAKAQSELRRSSYPELGRLQCELREDTLILRGTVSRFFLKQMAQVLVGQVLVEKLSDDLNIDNQIHVTMPR